MASLSFLSPGLLVHRGTPGGNRVGERKFGPTSLGSNRETFGSSFLNSNLNSGLTACRAAPAGQMTPAVEWQQSDSGVDAPHVKSAESIAQVALSADNVSSKDVMDADAELLVQTYARTPLVFVKGEGCWLTDAEGNRYLDMTAGIAVNALGHGDDTWVKAVTAQASTLTHISNIYYSVPQVRLAERLVQNSFADRVFFTNSGTESNEAAIKFARKYQRVVREQKDGSEEATEFIAFSNGFHGRTLGALALTSKVQYRTPFEPLMPGVSFLEFGDLESTAKVLNTGRVAAVFVEPVQGEGGIHSATTSFLLGLRKLCDENGALLVFDEVQCGLARTGTLWAHEPYGVRPDIMTVAKPLAGGLPMGAVLVTNAVASSIAYGDHGSTFAGSPLVCAAALAVLDRLLEPGFLEDVASKGNYLRSVLTQKLVGKVPHVKEVRGVGLLVGIELDVSANPVVIRARDAGMILITAGKGNVLRLVPPLTISIEEIDHAVDILLKCLNDLP